MLSLTNPRHNSLVSFRYSLSLFPICFLLSHFAITSPCFILTSSIPNSIMTYFAYKFWKDGNGTNDKHAKKLFYSSLFHLPILIILMMIHKRSWPGEKDRVKRIDPVLHQPFGVHVSEESDHK